CRIAVPSCRRPRRGAAACAGSSTGGRRERTGPAGRMTDRPLLLGRRVPIGTALGRIGLSLAVAFGALALGAGYWQVFRSADLSRAPDDAAVIAASRHVLRGVITDREGRKLAWNLRDSDGEPYRVYADPSLSPV